MVPVSHGPSFWCYSDRSIKTSTGTQVPVLITVITGTILLLYQKEVQLSKLAPSTGTGIVLITSTLRHS
jgi:hypothetical protein